MLKVFYAKNRNEYLAAASLWRELTAEAGTDVELACGLPPRWLRASPHLGFNVDPLPLSRLRISQRASRRLRERVAQPTQVIKRYLRRTSKKTLEQTRIVILGGGLLLEATALALLWDKDNGEIPVLIANNTEDLAKFLEPAGEVMLLMKPSTLNHDLLGALLNRKVEAEFGILTARKTAQITWEWHKPSLWRQQTSNSCVQIHNEERRLSQWSLSSSDEVEQTLTPQILKDVLSQRHLIVSLIGHGSGIDMDLSGVGILCGRTKEALEAASRDRIAPFCAIDGIKCHRNSAGLREIIRADLIQAAVLFANTCRGVAMSDSAYSMNLSLALGVIDGPTATFLSPHCVRATSLDENIFVESCVQAGLSLGSIASRLNELVRHRGEPSPFVLIGRSDFRPVPSYQARSIKELQASSIKKDCYEISARTNKSVALICVVNVSHHDNAYTHVDNGSDPKATNSQFCTKMGKDLWIYGKGQSSTTLKVNDSDWQAEDKMFQRLWAALLYLEMLHPLFAEEYNESLLDKTDREFRGLKDAVIDSVSAVGRPGRLKNSRLGGLALSKIGDQVETLMNSLGFLLADLLDRRGNVFLIESLSTKLTNRFQGSSGCCGCGALRSSWRLDSLLSADVQRWQLRCPSCGIVYDSPYQRGKLEYFGSGEIRGGETIEGQWLWSPGEEIMGVPHVHLAIYHSSCDTKRFKVLSTVTRANPDGSFAFSHTITARKSVVPESYWLSFTVLANLEITYGVQRLRVVSR